MPSATGNSPSAMPLLRHTVTRRPMMPSPPTPISSGVVSRISVSARDVGLLLAVITPSRNPKWCSIGLWKAGFRRSPDALLRHVSY